MDEKLLIVGINHRTASVAVRERLAYGDGEIVSALGRLKERAPALAEIALISTCNRVELYGIAQGKATPGPGRPERRVLDGRVRPVQPSAPTRMAAGAGRRPG